MGSCDWVVLVHLECLLMPPCVNLPFLVFFFFFVLDWEFDVFAMKEASDGRPLFFTGLVGIFGC